MPIAFLQHAFKPGTLDFNKLLAPANYMLQLAYKQRPWLGDIEVVTNDNNNVIVASNTLRNTPLYDAGVDFGDIILSLDEKPITTDNAISTVVSNHKPGDEIKLVYTHRNKVVERTLVLKENPQLRIVKKDTEKLTKSQQTFREEWMAPKRKK